jgi:hypothetical protein
MIKEARKVDDAEAARLMAEQSNERYGIPSHAPPCLPIKRPHIVPDMPSMSLVDRLSVLSEETACRYVTPNKQWVYIVWTMSNAGPIIVLWDNGQH